MSYKRNSKTETLKLLFVFFSFTIFVLQSKDHLFEVKKSPISSPLYQFRKVVDGLSTFYRSGGLKRTNVVDTQVTTLVWTLHVEVHKEEKEEEPVERPKENAKEKLEKNVGKRDREEASHERSIRVKREKSEKIHPMILHSSEDYDMDFISWLEELRKEITVTSRYTPYYVKDGEPIILCHINIKKQIRSLISFLYDIMKKGFCLTEDAFNPRNLFVRQDVIKFGLKYLTKVDKVDPSMNFDELGSLIRNTFFENVQDSDLPWGIRRLIELLQSADKLMENELLIRNHVSLMTERAAANFICECSEVKDQFASSQKEKYKLACERFPKRHTWTNRVKTKDTPFRDVYNHRPYSTHYTDQSSYLRNSVRHLLKSSRIDLGEDKEPHFTSSEVPKMILWLFDDVMTRIPEMLHQFHVLDLVMPEEFFY